MQIRDGMPNNISLNLSTSGGGTSRQTLNTNFAGKLRQAARDSSLLAQKATNSIASFVPGAAILSAGLGAAAQNLANSPTGQSPTSPLGLDLAGGTGEKGDFINTMQDMQQNMMSTNMQMLGVQRKFQQMSEYYLTASNILKTKHDTDKNSINNIR